MKVTQKIFSFLVLAAAVLTGCERDYDAPPLNEPVYDGPSANITIADLKENCKNATQETPIVITNDWVLRAYITGNDESGNIYKQVIVQDETGAMPIQVDENNVSNFYRRGQEVFVNLKGMCVSVYGDEQQLGWPAGGTTYRLPFTEFQARVQKNGWPYVDNVKPEVITDMSTVNLDVTKMTYRLVQMEGVHFENGGKNTFAKVETEKYGEENLKDAHGNVIMVRTSSFASFAAETLPVGTGTVVGILGRFKGTWQLMIPSRSDVFGFDGVEPGEGDGGRLVLPIHSIILNSMFDGDLTGLSARSNSGDGNIWFQGGTTYKLIIKGIEAGEATTATLIYNVGANVFEENSTQDLNALKVTCNGIELSVPSKVVSQANGDANKPFEIKIENVAVKNSTVLEFASSAQNTVGLRLFGVKLVTSGSGEGDGEVIKPEPTK